MESTLLLENLTFYLREHPEHHAVHGNYTVRYDKKTDSITVFYHDPSTADIWGVQPLTHIPVFLFQQQLTLVKTKGE